MRNFCCLSVMTLACIGLLAASAAAGTISYDVESNTVLVSAFPEAAPATLEDILDADRSNGWGRMEYDDATDTYTLRASLTIGTKQDRGTHFQIGSPEHPKVTLVLHGNLTVTPPKDTSRPVNHYSDWAGNRYDGLYRISNRLTLGDPENAEIRPTIKMACSEKNEFAVRVLADPVPKESAERWYVPIGELHMFHAGITSLSPSATNTYSSEIALSHTGVNYRMRDSRFAWWDGALFRTVYFAVRTRAPEDRTIHGMRFEHGGDASGPFDAVDCVFRDVRVARRNAGGLRCVFEENDHNVAMNSGHVGFVLTDCELGPSKEPLSLPRSNRDESWLRNYSVYNHVPELVMNPGIIERVSLVVRVRDEKGGPVRGAVAIVECPQDVQGLAVQRPLAVTGADGLTPSDAEGRALVITKRELRPTDDPGKPEEVTYDFRLRVSAPGVEEVVQPFSGKEAIPRPLDVTLRK